MAQPKKKSQIFVNPDDLPTLKGVIREFQRLKGVTIRVNPDFAKKVLEITEAKKNAVIRLSKATPHLAKADDVCILCDEPNDVCDPCDSVDYYCNGAEWCITKDECIEGDIAC